jgi:hypothetical protein
MAPMSRIPTRIRRSAFLALATLALIASAAAGPAGASAAQPAAKAAKPAAKSFKQVPLSALARSQGGEFSSSSFTFHWALAASPGVIDGRPTADQILLSARRSRCRSVHLEFVAGGGAQSAALQLTQRGRPTASASTNYDRRATLDVPLKVGGSWTLAGSTPASSLDVYVAGWASCYGTAGLSRTG